MKLVTIQILRGWFFTRQSSKIVCEGLVLELFLTPRTGKPLLVASGKENQLRIVGQRGLCPTKADDPAGIFYGLINR